MNKDKLKAVYGDHIADVIANMSRHELIQRFEHDIINRIVIEEYGEKIAEMLIDRGLVAMVKRNNISRKDITIGGTQRRRIYGFGQYGTLDATVEELKNIDLSVDHGHCAIVEYKHNNRMVTTDECVAKVKKDYEKEKAEA